MKALTRISYTKVNSEGFKTNAKPIESLVKGKLKVFINVNDLTYYVKDLSGDVLKTGQTKNYPLLLKTVKSVLVELGVPFESESRVRNLNTGKTLNVQETNTYTTVEL